MKDACVKILLILICSFKAYRIFFKKFGTERDCVFYTLNLSLSAFYFELHSTLDFMAFPQPNSRELQNRKILEELQIKKQQLLKQVVTPYLGTPLAATPTSSASSLPPAAASDGVTMSASQRAALHNAHAASTGYFVTQDSSFGNLILPVLPRFDSK